MVGFRVVGGTFVKVLVLSMEVVEVRHVKTKSK